MPTELERMNDMRICVRCGGRAYGHPYSDCDNFQSEEERVAEQEELAQLLVDLEWNNTQPGFDRKPPSWKAEYMARAGKIMDAGFRKQSGNGGKRD